MFENKRLDNLCAYGVIRVFAFPAIKLQDTVESRKRRADQTTRVRRFIRGFNLRIWRTGSFLLMGIIFCKSILDKKGLLYKW